MKRLFLSCLIIMLCPMSSYAGSAAVAKVNGVVITAADLEAEVDSLIPRSVYHGSVSPERRDEFREKALGALIDRELQYQDACAKGMRPDKKAVRAQMEQIRDRFRSKKEYQSALVQAATTEEELEARVARNVLVQEVIAAVVAGPARVSDAELKKYYDENRAKFKQPESVKLRLISTRDEKKAVDGLAKIKAGEDFGNIAAAMSEDRYRVMGGDLGYQHRGKLLPELEHAAFSLKPGEVSGLIKAADLWFIIKVEDQKPEQQMTFNESKNKLRKELESRRAMVLNEKWMADLKAKAKIEILMKIKPGQ